MNEYLHLPPYKFQMGERTPRRTLQATPQILYLDKGKSEKGCSECWPSCAAPLRLEKLWSASPLFSVVLGERTEGKGQGEAKRRSNERVTSSSPRDGDQGGGEARAAQVPLLRRQGPRGGGEGRRERLHQENGTREAREARTQGSQLRRASFVSHKLRSK